MGPRPPADHGGQYVDTGQLLCVDAIKLAAAGKERRVRGCRRRPAANPGRAKAGLPGPAGLNDFFSIVICILIMNSFHNKNEGAAR